MTKIPDTKTEWLCASALLLFFLGVQSASAQSCVLGVQIYKLNFESVHWTMKIGIGQSCIGGFRVGGVVLDNVRLVVPPKTGQVTLHGPGFTYSAGSDFTGEDSFTVVVSGTHQKTAGSSTIRVLVSVIGVGGRPNPKAAPDRRA